MIFDKKFTAKMQEITQYGIDRGFHTVDVQLEYSTRYRPCVYFRAYLDNRMQGFVTEKVFFESEEAKDLCLDELFEKVKAIKSPAEIQKEEFQKSLAKLIERARDIDIAVEFINPLVALSKKLSENAIEHHPEPAK